MAGTKDGGIKAAQTNKQKYGSDFYKQLGHKGGIWTATKDKPKGFQRMTQAQRKAAGSKGGTASRRTK